MGYGFKSVNSSNHIQIDEDYPNMLVVATGTATNGAIIDFPPNVDGTNVLIYARVNSSYHADNHKLHGYISRYLGKFRIWSGEVQYSGSTTVWDYFDGNGTNSLVSGSGAGAGTTSTQIDYVVCTQPSGVLPTPTSGFGLNVFKSDATLAYSSEYQIMHIKQITSILVPTAGTAFSPVTYTGQPDSNYVLINGTIDYRTTTVGPNALVFQYGFYNICNYTSNTIVIDASRTVIGPSLGSAFRGTNFNATGANRVFHIGELSA